jgi:diguanylate cyclase (GGDEF)-like protein
LAKRSGALVAVLFADLDGFKLVNDNYGHDAGDWVLQEVAGRWQACVRESETVARLGGDEFAVVLGDLHEPAAIAGMAVKLIEALQHDIALRQGPHCRVGASIGICIYPSDATEVDVLISMADSAMYISKAKGGNTYTFCSAVGAPPATS